MKIGIMQPYFFPYIGYWQLLNAVDKYVIYDDVNYIKGGWINRNRILVNNAPSYFNLPMQGASPNKLINEVSVNQDRRIINKNLRILMAAYSKAPMFSDVFPVIEKILLCGEGDVASYLTVSIRIICDYLNISTELIVSSDLDKDCNLKGEDKVLEICQILGATDYYNAIGGKGLYSFEKFTEKGIKLHFVQSNEICYKQFDDVFYKDLSIIDILMFNPKKVISKMLNDYMLIDK